MAMSIQKIRGFWALVGDGVDGITRATIEGCSEVQNIRREPGMAYHITLITKDEVRQLTPPLLEKLQQESDRIDARHVYSAGVGGGKDGVFFVVVIWAAGQQFRKRFDLQPKEFHITLTCCDNHTMDKSIRSLLPDQRPLSVTPEYLDHLSFTSYIFLHYKEARDAAAKLINLSSTSHKGFTRFADASFSIGAYKDSMLAYAQAYDRADDDKLRKYCIKKLIECSHHTEWGPAFLEHEKVEYPYLLTPWSKDLRAALSDLEITPSLTLEPRESLFIPGWNDEFYKLPRFFRWVIPYHLAVMSTPRNEDDIDALASPYIGIRNVLTLTEETPLPESWFRHKRISNTFLPIPNFYPPSIEQMDVVMRLVEDEKKLPLVVHCGGGKGRAGTVVACYLAAYGFKKASPYRTQPEFPATEAIKVLRSLRPGSIETIKQEEFVSKWCSTIWKRQSIYPVLPPEPPPCPMEVEGTLINSNFYILVGLPGSGKSWFSNALLARRSQKFYRISQDDIGSRSACESAISKNPEPNCVILDRCNMSDIERKEWFQLASNWAVSPICIWFDYERDLCVSRAQMRIGHPTLPPGSRVRNAITQMHEEFVRPQLSEGFSAVVRIKSFNAALEAIQHFAPLSEFVSKFPRTPHLIDIGAATPDDIVSSDYSLSRNVVGRVVVTEKIDGANMGFSLSADRSRILVQNRSRYVNSNTHEQFKKLGKWIEEHRECLYHVLDRDPYFAERYILYGEWLYATHSIAYTHLPDLFIAFDLYDRSTRQFFDRRTLEVMLEETKIVLVPMICEYKNEMPEKKRLLELIESKSKFYDGNIEGIYVKVERGGVVEERGKVVRGDFIAGNEHWTRGSLRVNGVASTSRGVHRMWNY